jgi:hypothetical protein
VIIAHRPETIASAQRRLLMCYGELNELPDSFEAATPLDPCQAA